MNGNNESGLIVDVAICNDIKDVLECQKKNQELRAKIAADERLIAALMERLAINDVECEIYGGELYIGGKYAGRRRA